MGGGGGSGIGSEKGGFEEVESIFEDFIEIGGMFGGCLCGCLLH